MQRLCLEKCFTGCREFLLRGIGWGSLIPSDSSLPAADLGKNYDSGYVRRKDGSVVPT